MPQLPPFPVSRFRWSPAAMRPRPMDYATVERVVSLAERLAQRSDRDLTHMYRILRQEVGRGRSVMDPRVLETTFAIASEVVRRALGLRFYEVQLLAGMALCHGVVAEMKTGEGKTLVAALPAILRALEGHGVHVATVNSYLARRDFDLLSQVYRRLDLEVGLLEPGGDVAAKQAAYRADVTYGPGYEFGFDFLRDQTALRRHPKQQLGDLFRARLQGRNLGSADLLQRRLCFAIIDEVDSVLLDEANTPMIISAVADGAASGRAYQAAAALAARLTKGVHFLSRPRERTVTITDAGQTLVFADASRIPATDLVRPWRQYVEQALRAEHTMRRDVDYVVRDQKIMLVDHYTGRIFADRTWQEGLHQAVECKEGVPISREKLASARISRQRFYRLYDRMCGMTGTAAGHEAEFQEFYRLPVVIIPERIACQRRTLPTRYFRGQQEKWSAIAAETQQLHRQQRPVLIGTSTIDESQVVSQRLAELAIPFQLLNGKQDDDEAELIARAGQPGAVTIATNMAGRGTDIKLAPGVAALGGLHVIATQRQESRRVDRQLVGRAARQGDPGSCQFFVAADDSLLQQFGARVSDRLRDACRASGETRRNFDTALSQVQEVAERERYQQRRDLHRHDQWLNDVLTTVAERASHEHAVLE